ncbi:hypothetical protein RJG79_00070 [Mycoplasmatota bacterium WC44]
MTKGSKIRGIMWLILAIAGIAFVATSSYTTLENSIDGSKIFEGKSEDQAGLEYLEIYSYKYEETSKIHVEDEDYSFDIHRLVKEEFNAKSNLYIVGKNIAHDGDVPKVGIIDVLLYCSSDDDRYEELVDFARLERIKGTKVYVGMLEIDSCEGKDYTLIIDGSRVDELYGRDEITSFNLADYYDIDNLYTAAQVEENLNLSKGFQGDLRKAGYAKYSWERAIINGVIAFVVMIPIAYGLYYSTEKELFGNNIIKSYKEYKRKNKK